MSEDKENEDSIVTFEGSNRDITDRFQRDSSTHQKNVDNNGELVELLQKSDDTKKKIKLTFHQAAKYGFVDTIQDILQNKTFTKNKENINKLDTHHLSALHYAIQYNHVEVVKLLLDAQADVNGFPNEQPLHFAVKYYKKRKSSNDNSLNLYQLLQAPEVKEGFSIQCSKVLLQRTSRLQRLEEMKRCLFDDFNAEDFSNTIMLLLQHGADVNNRNGDGETPLMYAVKREDLIPLVTLLQKLTFNDLQATDKSYRTALHIACKYGNTEAAMLLMALGANILVKAEGSITPLHEAMMGEGTEIVRKTIVDVGKHEGRIGKMTLKDVINDQTNKGKSIFHLAIEKQDHKMCRFLVEKGADVNLSLRNGNSPLHLAAMVGNVKILKLLLNRGADPEACNDLFEIPLHKAAKSNGAEVMPYLISQNCKVDALDKWMQTPLQLAVKIGDKEAVDILLQNGADVSITNLDRENAPSIAAKRNMTEILKLILDHLHRVQSSDIIHQTCESGNSLLHIASMKGYPQIVDLLLQYGAKSEFVNNEEETPLHLACKYGHKNVVELLVREKEYLINSKDMHYHTPLMNAALNCHEEIVMMLVDVVKMTGSTESVEELFECVCRSGSVKCAEFLLDRGVLLISNSSLMQSFLCYAASHGHLNVVKFLLSHGANIRSRDSGGRNALNWAIASLRKDVVLELLNHKQWILMMKNRFNEINITRPNEIQSAMRQLIKSMPDVAYMVLNNCMEALDYDEHDQRFSMRFSYELINDIYTDWSDIQNNATDVNSDVAPQANVIDCNQLTPKVTKMLQQKETHPVYLMRNYKCWKLLNHPLVLSFIYEKWWKFGRPVYHGRMIVYIVYLFFLTGYAVVIPPLLPIQVGVENRTECVKQASESDKESATIMVFVFGGRYVVMVVTAIQLILEFFIGGFLEYMKDFTNWLEWPMYILSMLFIIPSYKEFTDTSESCNKHVDTISYGACAVFLAWLNVLLFLQKMPKIGIYAVMFVHVTKTFLKFSFIFILFVVAFGLAFFILLGNLNVSFSTGPRSLMKTIVMMIGEFEFDTIFNNGAKNQPPPITWFFFFLLVIIMTILLMNVMVGLAVDDIKSLLQISEMNRMCMVVDYLLDIEHIIRRTNDIIKTFGNPNYELVNLSNTQTVVHPNRRSNWYSDIFLSRISLKEIKKAKSSVNTSIINEDNVIEQIELMKENHQRESEKLQEQIQAIQESLEEHKRQSEEAREHVKRIEEMNKRLLSVQDLQS